MTLAALIAAYHEADEPGYRLRATLPLAGRTVLERQARLAAAAGADPIVVAVERVSPELLAAIDRLRGQGLKVAVARNAREAAEAVHPGDRLLVIADGLVAADSHVARLVALGGPTLLTVPDVRVDDRFERIDAQSRWAGLALIDGEMLRRTAEMLRDWDLQSTLLRRAVQSGARQLALRGEPADDQLVVAERSDDLDEIEARMFAGALARRRDWVSAYLLAPLESLAVRALLPRPVSPATLNLAAAILTTLGGLAFLSHWLWLGMLLVLLATLVEGVAERLGAVRLQDEEEGSWWSYVLPSLAAGALAGLAIALAPVRGWGCIALAGTTAAFVVALRLEAGDRTLPGRRWLAEHKGLAWLLLPFALAGLWGTGLTVLAVYAGASFFWAQRHVHAPLPAPAED
ncbi:MAG: hypothetical protein JOZ90_08360 [Alphaproteobacteria bacterium]|nr:hypothetical protein [Alphaproteobacteria bacterium]MBV9372068.1 hypothetical protein [Alphaproteobacteria bacterium]MBV9901095.1 hypothetical protein [Alphaproteobacteria bacterium]